MKLSAILQDNGYETQLIIVTLLVTSKKRTVTCKEIIKLLKEEALEDQFSVTYSSGYKGVFIDRIWK